MGRGGDWYRVLVAELTGVAAGYAHVHRMDRTAALEELVSVLAARPFDRRAAALTDAAVFYFVDDPHQPWRPVAFALLVEAGADERRARELSVVSRRLPMRP